MEQHILVSNIISEESDCIDPNERHQVTTNPGSRLQTKKEPGSIMKESSSRGQSHSRESSGTSNLSVKFTIERETDSSTPSISESVSICSSPEVASHKSKCGTYSNYPSNKCKVKKKKHRSITESSGISSCAACENSSESEYNENCKNREHELLEDGDTLKDDQCDNFRNNLQQTSRPNNPSQILDYEKVNAKMNYIKNQNTNTNSSNAIDTDSLNQFGKNSECNELKDQDEKSSVENTESKKLQQGVDASPFKSGFGHTCISRNGPDVLDGTSLTYKVLTSDASSSGGGNSSSNDRNGHRRNISDARQPLLSDDDGSPSESSFSEEDAGGNNSGYTGRKPKNNNNTARDTQSGLIYTTDNRNYSSQEEQDIPGEALKTFLAFVFLFFAWVATTTSLALTHDRVPYEDDPLPDIFLDNVTYQAWGLDASEIIIMVSTWSAFLVTLFHKHRSIVLRRVFLLVGLHYYYRAITMFLTVLPVADKNYLKNMCSPPSNETTPLVIAQRVAKLLSGMGLAINGKHVYCGDYIYSGHTMTLIMGYLVIKEYSPKRWFLLHYTSMVVSIAGVVTLLLARGHYSIDVIIAYWITTRIWWMFHTIANNENLKEVGGFGENQNNYLKKIWWWYIFRYFECNVPACLPREFGWPVPKAITHSKPVEYICNKVKNGRKRKGASEATIANVESNMNESS